MFGFLEDMASAAGNIIGAVTGTVIGISSAVIAPVLGITIEMVEQAKESGCETYDEIREFWNL